ncbi:hypothetical protein K490DRAFT_56746 [Saccharata proteae CBS 121410]|uniref:BCAS2 family protein n=1 Tax=Saccharata proteae CBS 121410 TaxID=1314787 RepID=A0A9P4HXG1_9PEZI|nr:hypothetical protein K490DRAFT_56746 [Saccharata proteae CBS 121410]
MPLIIESHDSLPYIDAPPDLSSRAAIDTLIAAELDPSHSTTLHHSVPASYIPTYTPALTEQHDLLSSSQPLPKGIDLSRYEALEAPEDEADTAAWTAALRRAYAASTHLETRTTNLALLEKYGKNAWLISNSQLEVMLRSLEAELAAVKAESEAVEEQRRSAQYSVAAEMQALEETWKRGVGRVIETEAAAEALRREILERRREGAGVGR